MLELERDAEGVISGLKSFDQDRDQLRRGWSYITNQPDSSDHDEVQLRYAETFLAIAEIRYHDRDDALIYHEEAILTAQRQSRQDIAFKWICYPGPSHLILHSHHVCA
jgi:hypothetical protein